VVQASTPRGFAANHVQIMKQADAVLLSSDGLSEYQLENGKVGDRYERLDTIATKPLVLWASSASAARSKGFTNIEVAVPNDVTGTEGKCADMLRKFAKTVRIQRYAKLPAAMKDLKSGHLSAVCAPFVTVNDSGVQLLFASASFVGANGEKVEVFPGVPASYLETINEELAIYMPKGSDGAIRARVLEGLTKRKASLAGVDGMSSWAVAR
jgi:hypothetical protein